MTPRLLPRNGGPGWILLRWHWAWFFVLCTFLFGERILAGSGVAGETEVPTSTPRGDNATIEGRNPQTKRVMNLFDGKTLTGWAEADFAGRGEVKVKEGRILLGMGYMTGITFTNPVPRMNYEITLDAMRVEGSDFFCGLTFPVGKDVCSLVVGGWGGGVVGLSCIDGEDAANNETTHYQDFENRRWYAIRVRVTQKKIQAWIDKDKVVDQDTTDRRISIRFEMEPCVPLGVATWSTAGALRNIRIRSL